SATYFDGVPVNDGYGNIVALIPSPDAVSEFRVQTNSNSAEFGRFTGGVVNIASRSGSNNFHGGLYEYHRNKVLNANTFFGNRAGAPRPPFVQNQYGGYIGGPIVRDRLFFFGGYEGFKNREGVLFRTTVPTAAMRTGDFSALLPVANGGTCTGATCRVIYDPLTQCGAYGNPACGGSVPNRTPFPGNIIPANRISPISQKFLQFPIFAAPTNSNREQNFERNATTGGDNDQYNIRGDYNINDNNRLLVRWTRWYSAGASVDVYGNGSSNGDPYSPERFVTNQAAVADTWTINPTTVLDVRVGFMRWDYDRTPGHTGIDLPATFGLPASPYGEISERNGVPDSTRYPGMTFSNITYNIIGTGLIYAKDNTYIITPTLTKIVGRHTLKFGGELRRADINYFQNNNPGGTFTFNNAATALNGASPGVNTGDSLASFLLGIPNGGVLQISPFTAGGARYQGYFANDSWQVNQRLTLNLGVRWEIPGVYTERFDRQVSFNPNIVNPTTQQLGILNPVTGQPFNGSFVLVNSELQPERGLRPEKFGLFAPRVGIAYRLTDNTVLRAGGGMYFVPSTVNFPEGPTQAGISYLVNTIETSADNQVTFFGGGPGGFMTTNPNTAPIANPFPTGIQNPAGRDPNFQLSLLGGTARHHYRDEDFPGYTQQWNLAVQRQFAGGISAEVAYVGLQGKHLQAGINVNTVPLEHITRAAGDPTYATYLQQTVPNPLSARNGGPVRAGQLSPANIQRGLFLRPFAQFEQALRSSYLGSNQYHSLQFKADKRFGAGGLLSANYTFSKNTTNAETLTTWLESPLGGTGGYQNPTDLDSEWALSSFDARHRAVISYVVDLPFGQGQRFLNGTSGAVSKLVSGWSVNGATTFQAGFPLALTAINAGQGWPSFGYSLRPNVVANCDRQVDGAAQSRLGNVADTSAPRWFNTSCFTVPAPWNFGNESRTDSVLRGHGINNWNMTLSKKTNITEQVALTIRAEAFNLFNRVQFGRPNQQLNNTQFGIVTSQVNQPRLFQLAARLTF
ncbi:MAG: TonB-dependent receptor, partial [Candidatus Korobacteraceae bacterium]